MVLFEVIDENLSGFTSSNSSKTQNKEITKPPRYSEVLPTNTKKQNESKAIEASVTDQLPAYTTIAMNK